MLKKQLPKFEQYLPQTDKEFLRYQFPGIDLIDRNFSQAFQDLFVLSVLNGKREGYYLEIGCGHPVTVNNSFLLEQYFNWSGISIDFDNNKILQHKNARKNRCYCLDALITDYSELLKDSPLTIDYLQIDVCQDDDSHNNLIVLDKCLKTKHRFSVITYETNVYQVGTYVQEDGYKLLNQAGYYRIAKDVVFKGEVFEDWYVDPKNVNMDIANLFVSDNFDCNDILFKW